MKFNKILLAALALTILPLCASAQIGFDAFKGVRTLAMPSQTFIATSALVTNGPVDLVGLVGVGKVDFLTVTNSAATAVTATLYSSTNTSGANLVQCSNLWYVAGPTSITTSNYTYATAVSTNGSLPGVTISYFTNTLTCVNYPLLPGTVTTPNAATVGYSTPYLLPYAATNTGPDSLTGNTATEIGFHVNDLNRYLFVVFATSGAATNANVSTVITAPNMGPTGNLGY